MQAPRKIAVAGATGRVGRHIVDALRSSAQDVVPISRSGGVDVVTGEGLAEALVGVDSVIDVATSPDQQGATEFFTASARNLQELGERAGVWRIVAVSIIGCDRFTGGYGAAKAVHEQALLSGPIPVRILRAAQFHEFVGELLEWGRQGDVSYLPQMRAQPVAARAVAEAAVELATEWAPAAEAPPGPVSEIAGPREESLVEIAGLLAARRREPLRVEAVSDATDPDREVFEGGGLLPGPDAILAGPTFADWLESDR